MVHDNSEDKEECAWCKFMKGGPCRAVFETWQACVDGVMDAPDGVADEETRKTAVEKCTGVTGPLFDCLAKNPAYYGPQLNTMKERGRELQLQEEQAAGQAPAAASSTTSSSHGSNKASSSASRGSPLHAAASTVESQTMRAADQQQQQQQQQEQASIMQRQQTGQQ